MSRFDHPAIVVAGGQPPPMSVGGRLPATALIVAADSGYVHARALGLVPSHLVGDLDSIPADALADARSNGTDVQIARADKDETDTELAIGVAVAAGATRVVGVTGGGGRVDHELGTLAAFAGCPVPTEVLWGHDLIRVLHGPASARIEAASGALVSLIPFGGEVGGVTTVDLAYPLADATLLPNRALGVSNVVDGPSPSVRIDSGTLLVITPGVPL